MFIPKILSSFRWDQNQKDSSNRYLTRALLLRGIYKRFLYNLLMTLIKSNIFLFLKFNALLDEIVYIFEIRFWRRRWLVCARTQRETLEWLAQICSSRASKAQNRQKCSEWFYKQFLNISDQKRWKKSDQKVV